MEEQERGALYTVRTWLPEDQVGEWNRWHNETHVPEVVAQSKARRARKYRVVEDSAPGDWMAQYVTIYEFASLADFERYRSSEAAARLRDDYDRRYGASGKIARQVLEQTAEFEQLEED